MEPAVEASADTGGGGSGGGNGLLLQQQLQDVLSLRFAHEELRDAEEDVFRAAEELGIDLSRREPSSVEEV